MTYRCDEEEVSITKGSIDEETVKGMLPEVKQEIFVRGGASEVKDGVERYEGFSERFQSVIDEWEKKIKKKGLD